MLTVGVFGTLILHNPRVPHPDFSVQVMRHNLKILWLWKTFEGDALGQGMYVGRHCPAQAKIGLQWATVSFPRAA